MVILWVDLRVCHSLIVPQLSVMPPPRVAHDQICGPNVCNRYLPEIIPDPAEAISA